MASDTTWPALGWEEHPWHPTIPPDAVSRRVRERHSGNYQAAVVPKIATVDVRLPVSVLALADEASIEIAHFDASMGSDVAPFAAVLLRSESASSSQIEQLTSGAKAIALADIGESTRYNATQIVANVHQMEAAIALADRLDTESVLTMQKVLLEQHHADIAGRWRTQQVWIGGSGYGPHQAEFVPPHHQHVPALMDDLVAFIGRNDLPVLAQAALAHAQFETIHPFADGNGRTGRALMHAMLRGKGLTRDATIPISAGLLADTESYFGTLNAYRKGDAAAIVELVAEASFRAVDNGRALVADLRDIRERWNTVVHARRDSAAWPLADLLLRHPVIDGDIVGRELDVTSANAHRAIRHFAEAGVLTEFTGRSRNRLWQASEVISALDDFAVRAGRRGYSR